MLTRGLFAACAVALLYPASSRADTVLLGGVGFLADTIERAQAPASPQYRAFGEPEVTDTVLVAGRGGFGGGYRGAGFGGGYRGSYGGFRSGYGYRPGFGVGYRSGYGYGFRPGFGYGYRSGFGYGYGYRPWYGYGYRPFYGYGYGYRPWYGYGYGYRPWFGYGYGYGYQPWYSGYVQGSTIVYGGSPTVVDYGGECIPVPPSESGLVIPPISTQPLPPPATIPPMPPSDGGFRYDGGPNAPVPQPQAPPVLKGPLPQTPPMPGTNRVKLMPKPVYQAYGEAPANDRQRQDDWVRSGRR